MTLLLGKRLVFATCVLASLTLTVEGIDEKRAVASDDDIRNLKIKLEEIKKESRIEKMKDVITSDDDTGDTSDEAAVNKGIPIDNVNNNYDEDGGDANLGGGYDDDVSTTDFSYKDTLAPPYKKPPVCPVIRPCCIRGELKVILGSRGLRAKRRSYGKLAGVTVSQVGPLKSRKACSQSALVIVDFEKLDEENCFGCLEGPYCGARMLKIELQLSNAGRSGHLFDVGDSVSNDGHRGDYNHQRNDAEVHGRYPHVTVYPSDECWNLSRIMHIEDGIHYSVQTLTMYVSNEYVRITNSEGLDYRVCHRCLYALNGQPDIGPIGGPNQRIFIGLNRVVRNLSRVGYGVCSATFAWMCPWCE